VPLELLAPLLVHEGPGEDIAVHGVADPEAPARVQEALGELRLARAVDEDAADGDAALAARLVGAHDGRGDGDVHVGVVEHQQLVLPTQLAGGELGGIGGDELLDRLAHGEGAGEEDQSGVRMVGEHLAAVGSSAVDDVHHALREAGLIQELGKLIPAG